LESFTRAFWNKLMFGIVLAAPTVMVPLFNSWMIVSSILRLITFIEVACMMRRWSPCEAKTLKPSSARDRATPPELLSSE